ncbi:MAG: hypothetical protein KatS3mg119_1139 [Rhodothalassiaceae bacterium]|nr:MAG: hypothetical protein KatS3mg119_1139 [Rhodothalassiaceae bacterium]
MAAIAGRGARRRALAGMVMGALPSLTGPVPASRPHFPPAGSAGSSRRVRKGGLGRPIKPADDVEERTSALGAARDGSAGQAGG